MNNRKYYTTAQANEIATELAEYDDWEYIVEPAPRPGYAAIKILDEDGQFVAYWGE